MSVNPHHRKTGNVVDVANKHASEINVLAARTVYTECSQIIFSGRLPVLEAALQNVCKGNGHPTYFAISNTLCTLVNSKQKYTHNHKQYCTALFRRNYETHR